MAIFGDRGCLRSHDGAEENVDTRDYTLSEYIGSLDIVDDCVKLTLPNWY
jgi:hypothetical protein